MRVLDQPSAVEQDKFIHFNNLRPTMNLLSVCRGGLLSDAKKSHQLSRLASLSTIALLCASMTRGK